MERIRKKVDKEYEMFFMDLTRTSKANIFANSKEIELKKSIYSVLKEQNFTERQEEIFGVCENLLEAIYRYVEDNLSEKENNLKELVLRWIEEAA